MKLLARIQDRKIVWDNPDDVAEYLLPLDGQEVELIIARRKRSDKQNRFYWGAVLEEIVDQIERDTGSSKEDIHNHFKTLFLRYKNPIDGQACVRSTTQLKSDEFSEYVSKVKNQAAIEFNVFFKEEI